MLDRPNKKASWAEQPGSSEGWWMKPEIRPVLDNLIARGHTADRADIPVSDVCADVVNPIVSKLGQDIKRVIFCTDTDMTDRTLLSQCFVEAGHPPLFFGPEWENMFYKIVDFSNLSRQLRLNDPYTYKAYNEATKDKFDHNHMAAWDAEAHFVRTFALVDVTGWCIF
jgi:hypothetical protein